MKDRLKSLQKRSAAFNAADQFNRNGDRSSIVQKDDSDMEFMNEFSEKTEALRKELNELSVLIRKVKEKYSEILGSPYSDPEVKKEVDNLLELVHSTNGAIKNQLKDMKHGIDQDSKGARRRIQMNQFKVLHSQFTDLINDHNSSQVDYQQRCKGRIKKHLHIAGKDITDDEMNDLIEKGQLSAFTYGILGDSAKMKQMKADVEDRHQEILKLEKSILELNDLMHEMEALVHFQGETVGRIEDNVGKAQDYVEEGQLQVKEAERLSWAVRKKKVVLIAIITTVVIVLLLVIILSSCLPNKC